LYYFFVFPQGEHSSQEAFLALEQAPSFIHHVIGRSPSCGRQSNGIHRFRALQRRISWIQRFNFKVDMKLTIRSAESFAWNTMAV
jgi:hypothetical protein